jgi:hypothetical protein
LQNFASIVYVALPIQSDETALMNSIGAGAMELLHLTPMLPLHRRRSDIDPLSHVPVMVIPKSSAPRC